MAKCGTNPFCIVSILTGTTMLGIWIPFCSCGARFNALDAVAVVKNYWSCWSWSCCCCIGAAPVGDVAVGAVGILKQIQC